MQINNILALVQIMIWHRPGDKPLTELMMVILKRIYTSLRISELTKLNELVSIIKTYQIVKRNLIYRESYRESHRVD